MEAESFEAALKRLEEIVQELESGQLPLERSLELFEEGVRLSGYCSQKLDEVEKKVEILTRESKGTWRKAPLEESQEES